MSNLWKAIYIFLFGALIVLAVTHAKGFSTAAGTLFTGIDGMGTVLTGASIKSGT